MTFTPDFIDSFDNYLSPTQKWLSGSGTITQGDGRGGTARFNATNSAALVSPAVTATSTRIVGSAVRWGSASASAKVLFQWKNGTTIHTDVRLVSPSGLAAGPWVVWVTRNGTQIGTAGATTLSNNTWHHICAKVQLSATAGRVIVMVNGVEELNFTGITQNGATTTVNNITLFGNQMAYDDFYTGTSDDTTSALTDMPGDLRVVDLKPTGAGASTDFSPQPSGTPNWQIVAQALSSNESAWVHSNVPGEIDLYELAGLPSDPLDIFAVAPYVRARKDEAGTRTARVVARSNGVNYEGPIVGLTEGYRFYSQIHTTDPATSAAWTETGVDALQAGPKVEA